LFFSAGRWGLCARPWEEPVSLSWLIKCGYVRRRVRPWGLGWLDRGAALHGALGVQVRRMANGEGAVVRTAGAAKGPLIG